MDHTEYMEKFRALMLDLMRQEIEIGMYDQAVAAISQYVNPAAGEFGNVLGEVLEQVAFGKTLQEAVFSICVENGGRILKDAKRLALVEKLNKMRETPKR